MSKEKLDKINSNYNRRLDSITNRLFLIGTINKETFKWVKMRFKKMPEYDYKCGVHGYFLVHHPMDYDKDITCPMCGSVSEKQISAPSVHVRGGTPVHHKKPRQHGVSRDPVDLGNLD